MELALSLGDNAKKQFSFLGKNTSTMLGNKEELGFCMSLGNDVFGSASKGKDEKHKVYQKKDEDRDERSRASSDSQPVQLDLLPFSPVPRSQPSSQLLFPWLTNQSSSADAVGRSGEHEDTTAVSSPNSTLFSFQMDFGCRSGGDRNRRDSEVENERASSRTSDDDVENGSTRKKLRLSKEQSAFLEESFKEHSTLNPKQKLALARQLNLRPRQVEVWFQNRRARTKLKQTEVDCEYLKRCCETLTEENRRLQKELQELRALKTSQPFYMQLPATTLTMCPSCERVATTTASTSGNATSSASTTNNSLLASSKMFPFSTAGKPMHLAQANQAAN